MPRCQYFFCLVTILFFADNSFAEDGIDIEKGREFWAFKKPVKVAPPDPGPPAWSKSAIDRFVHAKLKSDDLSAPDEIEKSKLVRRVYFDLHGLPPSPEQIGMFLADDSPDAFESLVDQLLASPRFGERWGRHWLDVVRFAESTGGGRTMLLKHSWRYRDYVVDAFNQDKPYDEFVIEQLAGDLLPNTDPKEHREHLIATTFLALGPSNYELQDKELLDAEIVDEQIDTVGQAFMAMTLGCARCHDHMFDPISARDYYALAGIFMSTKTVNHSNVSQWLMADLPPITRAERDAVVARAIFDKRLANTKAAIAAAEKELEDSEDPNLLVGVVDNEDGTSVTAVGEWTRSTHVPFWIGENYVHDGYANGDRSPRSLTYSQDLPEAARYEIRVSYSPGSNRSTKTPITIHHASGERTIRINQQKTPPVGGKFLSLGVYEFKAGAATVTISNDGTDGVTIADAVQWLPTDLDENLPDRALAERRAMLDKKIENLHSELKEIAKAEPKVTKPQTMTVRDSAQPADAPLLIRGGVHSPGEIIGRGFPEVISTAYQPTFSNDSSGRLELAKWLVSDDHPLTARVMVNRLWMNLMGEGLVQTPDNFGQTGDLPTNPELLDYLALNFIENGWSMKQALREMVLSRTYRSVRPTPRRLNAEALRDAILATSGQLDLTIGGSTIKPNTRSEFGYKFDSNRRSLYLPVFRNALPDLFTVFDFPDPNLVAGKRTTSTLATQALFFMNHPFVVRQSEHAAAVSATDVETSEIIQRAYLRTLGRPPAVTELTLAKDFLGDAPDKASWAAFYQSLFACVDFRFVE